MPEQAEREGRARAFWSGTISFGLVSVPVDLFPANRSVRVPLRMLAPDGTPLARRYYCPEEEREVSYDEIVRGREVDGRWIVVSDEELEALEPRKSRDIDLRLFLERTQIDPIFFDRAYYLAPAGESTKAYRLLAQTMEETGRAGVATFVMRTKEYLVALVADGGLLRAETMRFADEIRSASDVGLPEASRPQAKRVAALEKAIRGLEQDELDETEMADRNAARLLEVVERKKAEGSDVLHVPEPAGPPGVEDDDAVIDLMEVLKQRLAGGGSRGGSSRAGTRHDGSDPDLDDLTKKELYERAKSLDIPGRSGMGRRELIRAIRRSA